jgi:hypothetical protein
VGKEGRSGDRGEKQQNNEGKNSQMGVNYGLGP